MSALQVASVCLCLSVAAVVGTVQIDPIARVPTPEESRNCVLETKITSDEIRTMQNSALPTTRSQFCMVSCIWKKANVITEDGRFLPENALEFIRLKFGDVDMGSLEISMENCLRYVSDRALAGKCMLGGLMYKCIMDTSRGNVPQYIPYK